MKSIIKLVRLLKLVNKVKREQKQPYKRTRQSYIDITDITKNDSAITRPKQS